jgi:predicted CoA-binding protein
MGKKTLVIGASLSPKRYSNIAINRLVENNIEVVAIGLRAGKVAGVSIVKPYSHGGLQVSELFDFKNIHTVTLYLNSKRQVDYYNYIVSLKPKRVIFNPGTENEDFYKLLEKNSIKYEVACTLVLLRLKQY